MKIRSKRDHNAGESPTCSEKDMSRSKYPVLGLPAARSPQSTYSIAIIPAFAIFTVPLQKIQKNM
jgi:hypothetical protein